MCSLCLLWVNFDFFVGSGSCTSPFLPMRVKFGALKQTEHIHLQDKFRLNVSASGCRKPQFLGKFSLLGGSCTDRLLPIKVKFGALEQTERLHLHAKFHLNVFIVSPSFMGKFLNFRGLLYRLPFTDKGQIWCPDADRTSTLTCRISSESVHCVGFQCPKTTILGKF